MTGGVTDCMKYEAKVEEFTAQPDQRQLDKTDRTYILMLRPHAQKGK